MGTEETEEKLEAKEPLLRYIIRQLFNQKVLLGVISLGMAWIAYRQMVNSGKQDTIIAKADTVAAKQVKIDSTTTVQYKGSVRRDSVNKVVNAKLDLHLHYDSLMMKKFNIKF